MLCTVQYNAMFSLGIFYCFFCNNSTSKVFAALIEDGTYDWTDEELGLLASQNLINTFRFSHLSFIKKNCSTYDDASAPRAVEEVRDLLASEGEEPDNSW